MKYFLKLRKVLKLFIEYLNFVVLEVEFNGGKIFFSI